MQLYFEFLAAFFSCSQTCSNEFTRSTIPTIPQVFSAFRIFPSTSPAHCRFSLAIAVDSVPIRILCRRFGFPFPLLHSLVDYMQIE